MNKLLLFLLLIFSSVFVCNAVNFNSPRSIILPSYQTAAVSGDLNNDGFPDLITGGNPRQDSQEVGRIYVMLGKGNGSFQQPQDYLVGNGVGFPGRFVRQIEVADLNNDGNLDVVVIHNLLAYEPSQSLTHLSVLFGNGNGSLQTAQVYGFENTVGYPTFVNSLALADMDKDGLTDIVFSDFTGFDTSYVHILKNLGNRNFSQVARLIVPFDVYGLVVADLNGDQFLDLILAHTHGVTITYSNSQFTPAKVEERDAGVFESAIASGDFNADGKIDFAVTTRATGQFRVFINTDNGFPEIPSVHNIESISAMIQSADLNGDNKPELLIRLDQGFQILYNAGNGTFNNSEFLENVFPERFAPADYNLDGKVDLGGAIFSLPNEFASVLLNSPNNTRYYTDFNGDRKSDFTVYRPSAGTWWTLYNGGNNPAPYRAIQFGLPADKIVPGNYDGDNKADIAVYRDGVWFVLNSSDNSVRIEQWGTSDDVPVPADFDNDGMMNLAVYRPSSGTWYIKTNESFYAVNWGLETDKPVPADFDGDGKTDIAVYRPSNGVWYIQNSKNGEVTIKNFGLSEDKPVTADYDGDGKSDVAVFRPSNGVWYIEHSSDNSIRYHQFGLSEDSPVINDFDGDGKNDISVFRQNNGTWYIQQSSNSLVSSVVWGNSQDIPVVNSSLFLNNFTNKNP